MITKYDAQWIGPRPEGVVCAALKRDLVLQPWQKARRIAFRFEVVWCVFSGDNLVTANGNVDTVTIHTSGHGAPMIGRADPYALNGETEAAKLFNNAVWDRLKDGDYQINKHLAGAL